MTHLDLFSGIGGLSIASEQAGFKTVAFVEREPFCQRVLSKNFPGVPIYDDVTTFNGRQYRGTDLVSAGFPCQPHSVAGKRRASGDERDLWSEVVRVLGETTPQWFVGENVPGLLSSESGRFFGRVVNDLAALGFRVGWGVWGASDVGACHRRKRVFIVAHSENVFRDGSDSESEPESLPELGDSDSPNDATDSASIRLDRDEPRPRPEHAEKEAGRMLELVGNVSNPSGCGLSGESRRRSRAIIENGYRELPSRDWRTWDIKPVFRSGDDGVPDYMVRHRVNILKALGNAVCPQQAAPLFQAIADSLK